MEFVLGEFIVKVKQDKAFSSPALMALNEKYQVYALEKVFNHAEGTLLDNIYLLHIPIESDILSIVQEYKLCPDVVYAELNGIVYPCGIPNDTNFSLQWSLHNTGQVFYDNLSGIPDADIDAPEAWEIEAGSPDVVIAILDTGIDYTHPDLAAKIWNNTDEIPGNGIDDDNNGYIDDIRGWDTFYNDSNVTDGYGHGTLCAGVAGAATNNDIGVAGVGWNCTIMPVRIANHLGIMTYTSSSNGIKYAADNDADVISMSYGGTVAADIERDAVNYAYGKGVFLCAAAHNYNTSIEYYPAAFENVTAVAATNQNDSRCTPEDWGHGYGSNYGDWVDIAAPGNLIYSTMPTYHVTMNNYGMEQNYDFNSGTSFSAPTVAGVAALLLSKNTSLTPDEVKALLCENVDPYNSTEYIGTGRLNAQKALFALDQQPPVADFSWTPQNPNTNQPITFNASASQDPDGTIILYEWDWDNDGVYDETQSSPTTTHVWTSAGSYSVTVRVTDNENAFGTITKTVNVSEIDLTIDITGGLGVKLKVTNTGKVNATDIPWWIHVEGGILGRINKTVNGTVNISAGMTRAVVFLPLLGLGSIAITAKVADEEKTAEGMYLFIFSIVNK